MSSYLHASVYYKFNRKSIVYHFMNISDVIWQDTSCINKSVFDIYCDFVA